MASFQSKSNYRDFFEVNIHIAKCVSSTLEERKPRLLFSPNYRILAWECGLPQNDKARGQKLEPKPALIKSKLLQHLQMWQMLAKLGI